MALKNPEFSEHAHGVTGAELVLSGLRRNGVEYIFANAGTDFPPIIEAFAKLDATTVPQPITVPHETASVAMAHGYYLMTGRAQAVMLHVNVGLANAAMGVINAASDNIPVLVMSGRTPITERGRSGSRMTPIQYGQEMFDQASIVSDVTKFHYEMRYPEQGDELVARALGLSMSEPRGPVYVSLPREPLMEYASADMEQDLRPPQPPATAPHPDPEAIATAVKWLIASRSPLIICQRGDHAGKMAAALAALAHHFAIPVVEPFLVRNVLASHDDMLLGYDVAQPLAEADVVLVVDSPVPWIESRHRPEIGKKIIHIGPDPNFGRMPIRGYQADLAIASDPAAALIAIRQALPGAALSIEQRAAKIKSWAVDRRDAAAEEAAHGCRSPMSVEWMSRCLSDAMDDRSVVFSELGVAVGAMQIQSANRVFSNPHSGGLGWALPAALGAQLADRRRLCIACIGDGSYIFANPVSCHQIATALDLPVLIIVKNNGMWNAVRRSVVASYPDGLATKAKQMPLTSLEPAPDYTQIAAAGGAYTERVEHGDDLPGALARAVNVIREQGRHVLLDLRVELSERQ